MLTCHSTNSHSSAMFTHSIVKVCAVPLLGVLCVTKLSYLQSECKFCEASLWSSGFFLSCFFVPERLFTEIFDWQTAGGEWVHACVCGWNKRDQVIILCSIFQSLFLCVHCRHINASSFEFLSTSQSVCVMYNWHAGRWCFYELARPHSRLLCWPDFVRLL